MKAGEVRLRVTFDVAVLKGGLNFGGVPWIVLRVFL